MSVAFVAVGGAAVAGIAGAVIGGNAAKGAAKTQAEAAQDATDEQRRIFEQQRQDQEPYRAAGVRALAGLETLTAQPLTYPGYTATPTFDPARTPYTPTPAYQGPTEAELRQDPGYQFRVAEGQKALERSAASKGLLLSGGQLKDLSRFGQELGAQEYSNVYQRGYQRNQDVYGRNLAANELAYGRGYQQNADLYGRGLNEYQTNYNTLLGLRGNQFRELTGIAGAGQGAVNTLGTIGAQTGQNLAETTIGAGNARAAGQIGSANAISGGFQNVAGAGTAYVQNQLLQSLLNRPNVNGVRRDLQTDFLNDPSLF